MKIYNAEYTLLSEKLNVFKELEVITESMCILDVDNIIKAVESRERLLENIFKIDAELLVFFEKDQKLSDCVNLVSSRLDLSDELLAMYDLSFKIRGCVNRIRKNENQIREYMQFQKDQILSKIESLNQSASSVANKYHSGVQTSRTNSLNSKKNRFI